MRPNLILTCSNRVGSCSSGDIIHTPTKLAPGHSKLPAWVQGMIEISAVIKIAIRKIIIKGFGKGR